MESLLSFGIIGSLIGLTSLEIILGVDNIIFIALIVEHLPQKLSAQARMIGLFFAFILRVLLLFTLKWMMSMESSLFQVLGTDFSGKDILLFLGGAFLIYKGWDGIKECFLPAKSVENKSFGKSFVGTIIQVIFIDFIFSFDSIAAAIGITREIWIIVIAMFIAIVIMFFCTRWIAQFIHEFPSIKLLALGFIFVIGVFLCAEGLQFHFDKGYMYFAMVFSACIEAMNIQIARKKHKALHGDASSQ